MNQELEELKEILVEGAKKLQVILKNHQLEQFFFYLEELLWWNQKINLTSITKRREIIVKHFLDSLSCLSAGKMGEEAEIVDLGSGAGFPGLPLKIARPDLRLTLVEATRKKANFLEQTIANLGLDHIEVVNQRAEEFARKEERRSKYDGVVARALAPLSVIIEYALPLIKVGGFLIAQKGKNIEKDLISGRKTCQIIGGEIEEVKKVKVPYLKAPRHLVLISKVKETPERFPRRPGIPSKRPLK